MENRHRRCGHSDIPAWYTHPPMDPQIDGYNFLMKIMSLTISGNWESVVPPDLRAREVLKYGIESSVRIAAALEEASFFATDTHYVSLVILYSSSSMQVP